ncbi:AraC family transcriptional regulator [Bifidobacterium sp.]|uniref:AraC family transcriptional regulator n=1 Tax=Bifidobacterium sp. TaxID=41200 RepID=UPI0025BBD4DC|nr:AraC family transcriptional regulator [Bifidobacterium sp.]MCH4209488.1 AraC family transcriptional regulator [Bifidobacterium sp.]MCI1225264.1 AraC family transcriptional regulator [Bifidobacterium sp.]
MMTAQPAEITKQTLQRRIPLQGLEFVAAGWQRCSPEHSQGPNVRGYYMLHFVLKGKGHIYINDHHYQVNMGQCFCIGLNEAAFYHSDRLDPWTYAWLDFTGEAAALAVERCGFAQNEPIITLKDVGQVTEMISRMLPHADPSPANDLAIQGFMLLALSLVQAAAEPRFTAVESADNELVKRAIHYVQEHSGEPLGVAHVAAHLFVSRGYLSRLFMREMSITLRDFILESKMSTACELLVRSHMPIQDVAQVCGYRNQFSFSRAFSRKMSTSPTEFRRLYARPNDLIDE